jgi:hypothetical protein
MRNLLSFRLRSLKLFFLLSYYKLACFCHYYDRIIMMVLHPRTLAAHCIVWGIGLRRRVNVILVIF